MIKRFNFIEKYLNKLVFNFYFKNIKYIDNIDLSKIGYKTTVTVPDAEKPSNIIFYGEGPAKAWFENSPNGIGYFNQELYNKIKDYHKNT